MMFEKLTKNLIPIAIVISALIISGTYIYLNQGKLGRITPEEGSGKNLLSSQEVAEKVINYINQQLKGQATASLIEIGEENRLYKIKFKIGDREFNFFASRDGKLLFPQAINLDEEKKEEGIPKSDLPDVKLFVMSFCPYGNQAEELMRSVDNLLRDKADIKLHYVIYSNYRGGGPNWCLDEENKYCSMHGIQELNQDVREICVQKYQREKLWDFLKRINEKCSAQNADSCWEGVAREVGLDLQKIKDCQKNESLSLLEEELQLNKKYGIQGSPQLIINGVEYQGERSSEGYKTGICSGFNSPPEECNQTLSDQTQPTQGGCR